MLRAETLPARHAFPPHRHGWNQLVYATSGALVVTVAGARHVITPEQAVWLPTGTEHSTGALDGAEFRNLYVADGPGLAMPALCTVYGVAPLLRALILELAAMVGRDEDAGYRDRVDVLLIDQLHRLRPQPRPLPWPSSPALRTLCAALYEAPGDARSVAEWGARLGASPRTLTRRFERETGLGLRAWRQRLRLFRALEWLSAGRPVTAVALDLGYAAPAAFIYMFRREMGCSPTRWRAAGDEAGT